VVYSNYGVYSMFRSLDGGDNWEKIAGNLEANENGTGDAPSIRWFKYVPVEDGMVYMVGTSVGLFASNRLDGLNTNWVHQAPGEIGNAVVDMIDYRQVDGTLAVATHGRGIFYARIFKEGAILSKEIVDGSSNDLKFYPNPVKDVLRWSADAQLKRIRIYNPEGKLVSEPNLELVSVDMNKRTEFGISFRNLGLQRGIYLLIADSDKEQSWHRIVLED